MKKLAVVSVAIFVLGIVLAAVSVENPDNKIVYMFTVDGKDHTHYYISIRKNRRNQTIEIPKEVYESRHYGDIYDPSWAVKHD